MIPSEEELSWASGLGGALLRMRDECGESRVSTQRLEVVILNDEQIGKGR